MKVLVTGASGFVGSAVVPRLEREQEFSIHRATRATVGSIDAHTEWERALEGVDVIVHLAARAHQVVERARDPLAEFRRVNVDGTARLADAAVAAGVRRVVLMSSVKVLGESGAFSERDLPPASIGDAYAWSKHEAEHALRARSAKGRLEVVVIRPPLVHGPGVRANLASLVRAIARGVPLPLGAIDNRRSLVGLDNLADFVTRCVMHPAAATGDGTYLVSDGEDVSSAELVRRLAAAMGRPARLVSVPRSLLRLAGALTGKRAAVDRLLGSLTVDITRARTTLGWVPPVTLDEGLRRMVQGGR